MDSQSQSRLLHLPSEIRNQIWELAFGNQHVVPSKRASKFSKDECQACVKSGQEALPTWAEAFRPLMACRQIYTEASHILHSTFTLHLELISCYMMSPSAIWPAKNPVRGVQVWVHISDENRALWDGGLSCLAGTLPALQELVIHAHMRPPDSYEKLIDGISLAMPLVRIAKASPNLPIKLHFDYVYHDTMFDSPYLGEITTEDSLEEHELVIRDLIEDDAFIETVLAGDDDGSGVTAALLRVARAHEQSWFEKLQRRRLARHTANAQAQQADPAEQAEQT